MHLNDSRDIAAPRTTVWAGLLSAEVLQACVPGCQELSGSAEAGFVATVVQKIGPVKATFKGVVILSDLVEGESLTLTGEGKGGAAGFAKGGAQVRLEDLPEGGTRLFYEVEAKVGGKLAQLGSRLIDGVARRLSAQFFEQFQSVVEGPLEPDPEAPDEVAKPKGWLKNVLGS